MDIERIKKNYLLRGYDFFFFQTVEDAVSFIQTLIPKNVSIGFGGSETVKEIKLLNNLPERTLLHRDLFSIEEKQTVLRKMHDADWYVSSANAMTESGDIVNIDGRGNRVGEIVNGPKNVLIVAGTNKLVKDVAEGIERTRNVASPKNCRRLNKDTPCAKLDKCCHCNTKDTICNATVILHHPMSGTKVYVVMIDQDLGY